MAKEIDEELDGEPDSIEGRIADAVLIAGAGAAVVIFILLCMAAVHR